MHKYRLLSKKGEGTFSEVLKAQSIKSGKHVAIKCMKNHFDSIDQVNNLREIQALRRLAGHPNIIKLHEVLYDEPTGRLALVFELMDMNLYEAIKGRRHYLPDLKVRHYMYEMLKAIDHMHRNGIFHRDVKPENLLLEDDVIKLADLGSCRGIYSRQPFTEYISTRWYRAPECLLTDGYYNFKMDLFAAGAVCFEIVALFPLFPGSNEMDQIQKIHNILGTPSPELLARKFKRNASHMDFNFPQKSGTGLERLIPHADVELVELMKKLIRYDPDERILARQALKDSYFRELREADRAHGEKDAAATTGGSASRRDPSIAHKAGMSSSSSAASTGGDHADPPEAAHEPGGHEAGAEERSGGLPTIRHERRKSGGGGAGGEGEDGEVGDGMVLPPIGGIKGGKSDSKAKPQIFKTAANATLQKSTLASHGSMTMGQGGPASLNVMGSSKTSNATGLSAGMSSAMSSTNPHSWVGAKDPAVSTGSSRVPASEQMKMNSTWAPNHSNQPRRYVSPFSGKAGAAGPAGASKKRGPGAAH